MVVVAVVALVVACGGGRSGGRGVVAVVQVTSFYISTEY